MNEEYLLVSNLGVAIQGRDLLKNISFTIRRGEQWAITGPSGSGKTVLAHTLAGYHFFTGEITSAFDRNRKMVLVNQQHRFKDLANQSNFYYQQRFNSFDAENTITVKQAIINITDDPHQPLSMPAMELVELLNIGHLLNEPLIQLSNGENKRLQLVKALLRQPEILLLDQPFIGLDASGREELVRVLKKMTGEGLHIVLFSSSPDLPELITNVAVLENGSITKITTRDHFKQDVIAPDIPAVETGQLRQLFNPAKTDFETVIRMINVTVRYEGKEVLQNLDWEVKAGEHWAVSGPNGSGKSTLLSLVTGDNPQAYANEIYLFDKRRGTGESIWDIKQKIGFISPELHLYFDRTATGFQAVASGFFDTIGLFRTLSRKQEAIVLEWMQWLGLSPLRNQLLSQLSLGQQRLILLARALVKQPPVLILDEPCQGLDDYQISYFTGLIDAICKSAPTTLIYVSHYDAEWPHCIEHFLRLPPGRNSNVNA